MTNANSAMRSAISRDYGVPFNNNNAVLDGDLVKVQEKTVRAH